MTSQFKDNGDEKNILGWVKDLLYYFTEEKNGKNFESKEYCCWFVLFDVIAGIYNYSKCRNTVCSYYSVSAM